MEETIKSLLHPGKGVLAADESTGTIEKRFAGIGLTSTPELNQKYRQMLFGTEGIEEVLSGVILYDETVRQDSSDGMPFPQYLTQKGIVPGIKVDKGLTPFNNSTEQITEGLNNLESRLREYFDLGLKFTKWRAAISISDLYPSDAFLEEGMTRMAEFARLSQSVGMVPFVEPEILLTGNHTNARCEEISVKVWKKLFEKLKEKGVDITKIILKTSMVLPGKDSGVLPAPLEVAQATLRALRNAVPPEVPGVLFLSGGQTPDEATKNLNEIVKLRGDAPWQLSFSFARALQDEALHVWEGKDENVSLAQETFIKRLAMVSKARKGELE